MHNSPERTSRVNYCVRVQTYERPYLIYAELLEQCTYSLIIERLLGYSEGKQGMVQGYVRACPFNFQPYFTVTTFLHVLKTDLISSSRSPIDTDDICHLTLCKRFKKIQFCKQTCVRCSTTLRFVESVILCRRINFFLCKDFLDNN